MQGIEIPIGAPLGQLDKDLKGASSKLNQFAAEASKTSAVLGGATVKGSNQAAFALTNLGRVAQDAPFGFIGIQNNLNPLLESFQQLKAQSGSTGGALKALGQSLIGPAGLGIALSLVTAAFTFYTQYQQKAKTATKETTQSFKEQKDEFLKSPYEKAVTGLTELATKISLAKQGFLDKKSVLKEYNDSIGKTIGKVNDLNAAEQALIDNGDKYLQLMLLKAKAEFAFKKAAEASYDIVKKQSEIEVNKNPLELDTKGLAALNKLGKKPITAIALQTQFDEETELKKLNTFANRAVNIAKKAEQEVIDFAKKSGFNLNGLFDIDTDKLKGDVKTVEDILKALDIDKLQIGADLKLLKSGQFIEEAKVIQKAINDLIGIGVSTESGVIKKLQQDLVALDKSGLLLTGKQLGLNLIQGVAQGAAEYDIGGQIGTQITEQMSEGFNRGLPVIAKDLGTKLKVINQALIDFNASANDIIQNSIINTFNNLGTAVGEALATGGNVLNAVGNTILQGLAGFLSEMGSLLIKYGTLAVIKGKLDIAILTGGPIAIGAGLAAIAVGIGLKAAGGAIGSLAKAGNGSNGAGSVPVPQGSSTISTSAAGSAQDFGGGRVIFEISGTNLVGVLNRAGAKLQRFGP